MIVRKNLDGLVISSDDTLLSALKAIEKNKHKIIYVVDDRNRLLGVFADGDFRRWAICAPFVDLSIGILDVCNRNFFSMSHDSLHEEIAEELGNRKLSIPLLDGEGHLLAIAESGSQFIDIGGRRISPEDPAFIIAEIGNNHQGDIKLAKQLVDMAYEAGADCVKFQMRDMDSLYGEHRNTHNSQDLGAEYTLDLLKKYQLQDEELYEVFEYCKTRPIIPMCTPWDLASLKKLEDYGLSAYKVASADFTNYELLDAVAETGKPMICSTGMCTENEIISTIEFLERKKAQFVLLHCNSTYPTPYKDINLNYIKTLSQLSDALVGYSGHERGWAVPVSAVSIGAKVIEKHFTSDKELEGNDHKVSLLQDEFKSMVSDIRVVEESLGNTKSRVLTQGEMLNREILAKSLFLNCDIKEGQVFSRDMISIRSPGNGLQPNRLNDVLGKKANRNIFAGEVLFESDLRGRFKKKERYDFRRPYGIPVRFHDYEVLTSEVDLDFVEFHLSYADMSLNIANYIKQEQSIGFAVHAPELFEDDHLLDLAADDDDYRMKSIRHLQGVIDLTRDLSCLFPKTPSPVVVVNAGGWNRENFWPIDVVAKKYKLVKTSLEALDKSNVTIAIQTMPPFPWHFGGQSHHSLFVHAEEIVEFCKDTNTKICLDLSHSMMACNYYEKSIYEFVENVAPYTCHFHVVDAKGVDGEGVQIGHGDVDFRRVGKLMDLYAPSIQFIPEIWQGHKDSGDGFWRALDFLENKFNEVVNDVQ